MGAAIIGEEAAFALVVAMLQRLVKSTYSMPQPASVIEQDVNEILAESLRPQYDRYTKKSKA